MDSNFIWLMAIVLISYGTQAMSGFGSTILALTLGTHLYPMSVLLPVLVALDLLVNLYIVTRHHKYINRALLIRTIIPAMGIGCVYHCSRIYPWYLCIRRSPVDICHRQTKSIQVGI